MGGSVGGVADEPGETAAGRRWRHQQALADASACGMRSGLRGSEMRCYGARHMLRECSKYKIIRVVSR